MTWDRPRLILLFSPPPPRLRVSAPPREQTFIPPPPPAPAPLRSSAKPPLTRSFPYAQLKRVQPLHHLLGLGRGQLALDEPVAELAGGDF